MPKYYVRCLEEQTIVTGYDALDACVAAFSKLGIATVGIYWVVSERGFEKHEDDVMIPDHYIMEELARRQRQ